MKINLPSFDLNLLYFSLKFNLVHTGKNIGNQLIRKQSLLVMDEQMRDTRFTVSDSIQFTWCNSLVVTNKWQLHNVNRPLGTFLSCLDRRGCCISFGSQLRAKGEKKGEAKHQNNAWTSSQILVYR